MGFRNLYCPLKLKLGTKVAEVKVDLQITLFFLLVIEIKKIVPTFNVSSG